MKQKFPDSYLRKSVFLYKKSSFWNVFPYNFVNNFDKELKGWKGKGCMLQKCFKTIFYLKRQILQSKDVLLILNKSSFRNIPSPL